MKLKPYEENAETNINGIYLYNIRNTFEFHHHTWTRKVSDKNLATFVTSSRSFRSWCWVVADRASVFFSATIAFILVQPSAGMMASFSSFINFWLHNVVVGRGKTFSLFCHKRTCKIPLAIRMEWLRCLRWSALAGNRDGLGMGGWIGFSSTTLDGKQLQPASKSVAGLPGSVLHTFCNALFYYSSENVNIFYVGISFGFAMRSRVWVRVIPDPFRFQISGGRRVKRRQSTSK